MRCSRPGLKITKGKGKNNFTKTTPGTLGRFNSRGSDPDSYWDIQNRDALSGVAGVYGTSAS